MPNLYVILRPKAEESKCRRFFASLRMTLTLISVGLIFISSNGFSFESEVIEESYVRVLVREHPKTGRPYVTIVPASPAAVPDPFEHVRGRLHRPNYRMLDPKVKSGEIPYDGPYSDSTTVYAFAATLATLGTVGGAVGMAVLPAAGGGAASGAGAYLASGGAVVAGSAAGTYAVTHSDSTKDEFIQISKSENTMNSSGELNVILRPQAEESANT